LTVAGAIERGLAVGPGVGTGDGVAGPALLVTTAGLGVAGAIERGLAVGLDVAVFEQATAASSKDKIEPIRARRPVRTLSSSIIYIAVAP
jgi:hypothetical protein